MADNLPTLVHAGDQMATFCVEVLMDSYLGGLFKAKLSHFFQTFINISYLANCSLWRCSVIFGWNLEQAPRDIAVMSNQCETDWGIITALLFSLRILNFFLCCKPSRQKHPPFWPRKPLSLTLGCGLWTVSSLCVCAVVVMATCAAICRCSSSSRWRCSSKARCLRVSSRNCHTRRLLIQN